MKTLKPNVYSYIPLYVFDYPLLIFGIALFITNFSLKSIVLIIVFWAASSATQGLVTHVYNCKLYFNFFYLYLLRYRNCTFERFKIEDFIPHNIVNEFLTERLGIGLSKKPLGYITVIKRMRGVKDKQFPAAMTAFPFETEPWYIMVSDKREDFYDYQWFLLFHEIGHTMLFHRIPLERSLNLPIQIIMFTIILLLICPLSLTMTLFLIGLSLTTSFLFATYKTPAINFEILADTFSLLILNLDVAKKIAVEHIEKLKEEISKSNDKFEGDKIFDLELRIKNVNEILEHRLINTQEENIQEALRKFNIAAKSLLWSKWYFYLLIVMIVSIGLYFQPPILTWYPIWLVLTITAITFLLTLFIIKYYRRIFVARIETIMAEKHVSSDLYSEHFLNVENVLRKKMK